MIIIRIFSVSIAILVLATISPSVASAEESSLLLFPVGKDPEILTRHGDIYVDQNGDERPHQGVDISGAGGAEVMAMAGGVVTYVGMTPGESGGLVNCVTVEGEGYKMTYRPITPAVKIGDTLEGGEPLGRLLEEGDVSTAAPHLNFTLRDASTDEYLDPEVLWTPWKPAELEQTEENIGGGEVDNLVENAAGEGKRSLVNEFRATAADVTEADDTHEQERTDAGEPVRNYESSGIASGRNVRDAEPTPKNGIGQDNPLGNRLKRDAQLVDAYSLERALAEEVAGERTRQQGPTQPGVGWKFAEKSSTGNDRKITPVSDEGPANLQVPDERNMRTVRHRLVLEPGVPAASGDAPSLAPRWNASQVSKKLVARIAVTLGSCLIGFIVWRTRRHYRRLFNKAPELGGAALFLNCVARV